MTWIDRVWDWLFRPRQPFCFDCGEKKNFFDSRCENCTNHMEGKCTFHGGPINGQKHKIESECTFKVIPCKLENDSCDSWIISEFPVQTEVCWHPYYRRENTDDFHWDGRRLNMLEVLREFNEPLKDNLSNWCVAPTQKDAK